MHGLMRSPPGSPPSTEDAECLDDERLVLLVEGKLDGRARADAEAHLEGCDACQRLVAAIVRDAPADTRPPPGRGRGLLDRGACIGRYLVLSLIGRGTMGEVYAAYDPELDRRVALKLVHTVRGAEEDRARLVREARALGKLSHPNVVHVYDVGEHEHDVFVAMELVDGDSLDAWCRTAPAPGWQAVLAAYRDAARGLSAAHAQGLVHRDVKPSNILRGRDGRVRVVDFGLVAPSKGASAPTGGIARPAAPLPRGGALDDRLTATGALVGTPRYMAPEQHEGSRVGPESDQYSLCVALHEALYGAPPFTVPRGVPISKAIGELFEQKKRGAPTTPPARTPVPAWIYEALVRGLAPRPEDRYPSLEALVMALGHDPLAREHDLAVGARPRFAMASLFWLGLVAVSLAAWFAPRRIGVGDLLVYILVIDVILAVSMALWHRKLLSTEMGRAMSGSMVALGLGIAAHRLIALRFGTPASQVLTVDNGYAVCVLALTAYSVPDFRRQGTAFAVVMAASVAVMVAWPDLAVPSSSFGSMICGAGFSYLAYRQAKGR
jgi:hypothetical protein